MSPAGVARRGLVELCRDARRRLLLLAVLVPVLTVGGAAAAGAATLRVNTTTDEMTPHDGKCSLREAIDAANSPGTRSDCGKADSFSNLIFLRAKTYQLSIPPTAEIPPAGVNNSCVNPPMPKVDENATGDLCVTSNGALTITGEGPSTVIQGQSTLCDRLMTIAPQASVNLFALTMEGGHAPDGLATTIACAVPPAPVNGANGGAVYNTGTLFTNIVTFQGNVAGAGGDGASGSSGWTGGNGGAIYNDGTSKSPGSLTVQNTMFKMNAAGAGGKGGSPGGGNGGAGGSGGAIYNNAGTVQVAATSFWKNSAGDGGQGGEGSGGNGGTGGDGSPGGGIYNTGGSLSVINGTFFENRAGSGGNGGDATGGNGGNGGDGADGGAVAVVKGASGLRNATLQNNARGAGGQGGTDGSSGGSTGTSGTAGGIFVHSTKKKDNLNLQNTIVASSIGQNCLGNTGSAITDGGHNLNFPSSDSSCPAATSGDPKLKGFDDYGGYTGTLALAPGSAAINQVSPTGAGCPSTDQRGVRRPQGSACDIGAFEFARPKVHIYTPRNGARYKRGSRVHAYFRCAEGGITSAIATCKGTVDNGKRINTSTLGKKDFKVTATDKEGNAASKTVHYTVVR